MKVHKIQTLFIFVHPEPYKLDQVLKWYQLLPNELIFLSISDG